MAEVCTDTDAVWGADKDTLARRYRYKWQRAAQTLAAFWWVSCSRVLLALRYIQDTNIPTNPGKVLTDRDTICQSN